MPPRLNPEIAYLDLVPHPFAEPWAQVGGQGGASHLVGEPNIEIPSAIALSLRPDPAGHRDPWWHRVCVGGGGFTPDEFGLKNKVSQGLDGGGALPARNQGPKSFFLFLSPNPYPQISQDPFLG